MVRRFQARLSTLLTGRNFFEMIQIHGVSASLQWVALKMNESLLALNEEDLQYVSPNVVRRAACRDDISGDIIEHCCSNHRCHSY